ncbi:MAG: cupin domain-containing protein [Dehalococcoidia bacterium]|nr:cupin domain-containing protein [Dehalococcoidia bacterium]
MARAGDVIDNPVRGERIVFSRTAQETNGEVLEFAFIMTPHVTPVLEHVHLQQEERVHVVSGAVRYRVGGAEHELGAGDAAVLPPGIPHTLWNAGDDEAHVVFEVRPALNTEAAFETLFGLARDGKTNKQGMPNPLQGILLAREYETFFPKPPVPVQKALVAVLAPIARLLGYRARYEKYSGQERD